MNLGDGLKLETQVLNGKARILLAPCDDLEKDTKKVKNKRRTRTQLLRTKQAIQELAPTNESYSRTEKTALKPAINLTAAVPENSANKELITAKNAPANSTNHGEAVLNTGQSGNNLQKPKTTVKKVPTSKQPPRNQKILSEDVRKNLLCLTQEQLQQILSSITHVKGNSNQNQEEVKEKEVEEKGVEGVVVTEAVTGPDCKAAQLNSSSQQPEGANECGVGGKNTNPDKSTCKQGEYGLFTCLGERENGKELLEAKKIQWKKELDEQVAYKKQFQKSLAPEALVEWNPWGSPGVGTPMSVNTGKVLRDGEAKVTSAVPSSSGPSSNGRVINIGEHVLNAPMPSEAHSGQSSHFSSPDVPAAIRSVFVLGEAVPTEDLFNAVKREQQQKWLQELDKQREELKARKIQEKLKYAETEDHSRWAMHFDSFQKKSDLHFPVTVNAIGGTVEKPLGSYQQNALSEWQQPSVHCVPPPNHLNTVGTDVHTETHPTATVQKASFLRSMTALLDPAQLDERELRRQKQQEHQKAIAVQVEERRRHKQLQEDKKRQEDEKEELRLVLERNKLQQQYEEEKKLLREKEKQTTRKTNQLYEVIQRAQEMAQREKQEHRMKELARKGHDISNLQKNIEGCVCQSPGPCNALSFAYDEVNEDLGQMSGIEDSNTTKQCVQKEHCNPAEKVIYIRQVLDHNLVCYTPDISAEYKMASNENRMKKEQKPIEKMVVAGKENVLKQTSGGKCTARVEGKEKLSTRPEWNSSKTNKKYIPASKRYPVELQEEREVSKMRRQAELLHLLEKNAPEHRTHKQQCSAEALPEKPSSPETPALQAKVAAKVSFQAEEKLVRPSQRKEKNEPRSKSNRIVPPGKDYRCDSPPVPAVKNKLLQMEPKQVNDPTNPAHNVNVDPDSKRPPSSKFVPYVRTDEVYHLDPDAPMSRPSTNDPQYRHCKVTDDSQIHSSTAGHEKDPLLNPDLVRNRERQQAILKGLSELRQGLMQKRKELETSLTPIVLHQDIPSQHI
uniref:Coiled-coil domain-containing protein 66-like protein n=1 Tax=Callorhinchus milii TaxID=7868 RepID=V9KA81_CALMI